MRDDAAPGPLTQASAPKAPRRPGREGAQTAGGGALYAPSDFFTAVRKSLKPKLPNALRGFRTTRGRGRLMKVYYDAPAFHYEAWHHSGAGKLEVGLHFESSAELNQAAFDFFRSRMVEVKASLPRAELEPWDRGWSRLYETLPAPRLDEDVLWRTVDCLAGYVVSLQPLVDQFWKESR